MPHDRVSEHSRLFITHAGHGSVMRGLIHGVPMVLVPSSRDQPGVARRAAELGVGVVVDRRDLSGPSMRSAAERALFDTTIAETARRVSDRLHTEDPIGQVRRILMNAI